MGLNPDARPAIAQLAEHLTVDLCSYQMVPGSIPGGRKALLCLGEHCLGAQNSMPRSRCGATTSVSGTQASNSHSKDRSRADLNRDRWIQSPEC